MRRALPIAGIALLALASVQVYSLRHRILHVAASPELIGALHRRLSNFPPELGEGRYRREDWRLDPRVVAASGADTHVARAYRDEAGRVYRVYIGGAINNHESFHAPNYCMPAAGWEVLRQDSVPSPMSDGDGKLRRLDLRKGHARMLVYYWFQCGRRQTDHDLVARWYRFLDFLAGSFGRNGGETVQPTMIATIYVPFDGSADAAEERAYQFMRSVRPALHQAIDPQEN